MAFVIACLFHFISHTGGRVTWQLTQPSIPFHKSLSKTQQDSAGPVRSSFYTFFRAACSVLSADSICLQVCLISGHRFLLAIFWVTIDNKQQFESEEFSGPGPGRQANLLKRSQMISV